MTFDFKNAIFVGTDYGWRQNFELICVCRNCVHPTIFKIHQRSIDNSSEISNQSFFSKFDGSLNNYFAVEGYISLRETVRQKSPDFTPPEISKVFNEGATCLAVECWNAAATMFRMCVDMATRPMLPEEEVAGLNKRTRRDLGLRLPWLFETGRLPKDLHDLSSCVKEDGNDGAHAGTLTKVEADDLLDFTISLLERIYTEPGRIAEAQLRRDARRNKPIRSE